MSVPANRFAILVRHDGWIDQYLRAERHHHTDESMNGWTTDNRNLMQRFDTLDEARIVAAEFTARFGNPINPRKSYRFDVIECRYVPRWFLASGEHGIPVG